MSRHDVHCLYLTSPNQSFVYIAFLEMVYLLSLQECPKVDRAVLCNPPPNADDQSIICKESGAVKGRVSEDKS